MLSKKLVNYLIFRDSERKSMSTERTFHEINKPEELYSKCKELCDALAEDLAGERLQVCRQCVSLKPACSKLKLNHVDH